ncbi:hypothetical protein DM01DRAFT_1404047 [Hesseltinella vesiculosa]|uniref:Uncharacterized protein n=1 Tax=Hesseltinella vesiculosa TaxID=101127 RepID=A0A1X2GXS3_9FUNG|nr:hypothetical protein DM01DRAFT_1404047 [Hesseltinella vesiculosa]
MSRRTNKKKDLPNFTFQLPGSVPNSPVTFGSAPNSPLLNTAFSLQGSSSVPSSPNPGFRRSSTDLLPQLSESTTPMRRTFSDTGNKNTFSFGGQPPATANSPSAFGQQPQPASASAFGQPPVTPTSAFTFGSATGSSASAPAATTPTASTFSFGSTPAKPAASSPSAFSFGNTPTKPTTSFGFSPSSSTAATAASVSAPAPAKPGFSFGDASNNKPASPFTFPSTTSAASSVLNTPSAPPSNASTGAFSFTSTPTTAKTALPAPSSTTPASSAATTTAPSTGFTFTAPGSLSSFGDDAKKTPSFQFSAPTANDKPAAPTVTPAAALTATTATPVPALSSGFSFKPATSAAATSAAPATSTTSTSQPSFTFALPGASSSTPATSTPATTAATSVPTASTFSFAASTTTPAPVPAAPSIFSFEKTLKDLEAANAHPTAINAALLTPEVLRFHQAQASKPTMHTTNFRIDNIQPSTRFSELPQQAQMELDEVQRHIEKEISMSKLLASQRMPEREKAMKSECQTIDDLTQKWDILKTRLMINSKKCDELLAAVQEHCRHAYAGQSVIEASKNPGMVSTNWMFGHGGRDDYFCALVPKLQTRLVEYKKTLADIELAIESLAKKQFEAPQDLATVANSQNETFLLLANRVAQLHENINMAKALYLKNHH